MYGASFVHKGKNTARTNTAKSIEIGVLGWCTKYCLSLAKIGWGVSGSKLHRWAGELADSGISTKGSRLIEPTMAAFRAKV